MFIGNTRHAVTSDTKRNAKPQWQVSGVELRSAEWSLPFFETLKNITRENRDEYRWMEEVEEAFQKM